MDSFVAENPKKLPQKIHALIGEIGEKQVLLRLYLLVQHTTSGRLNHKAAEKTEDTDLRISAFSSSLDKN